MLMRPTLPPPSLRRPVKSRHMPTSERSDTGLVIGNAPWWIVPTHSTQLSAKNKKQQKQTFAEALKDFLQNVSFHCYGKLVEPGRRFQERFFWLIFHIGALAILIIFLWNSYQNDDRFLATTIYDPLYPVTKVAFPAISICSINRISNSSAIRYAEELNQKDPLKHGIAYFYEMIQMLSYNYIYQNDHNFDYVRALDFQRFLDLYDTDDSDIFYNTRVRMAMLTPRCSDILLECRLAGVQVNCSDEFTESLSSRGICCTFNKQGKYATERSFKMRFFTPEDGLVVLLNASCRDNFYKTSALDGFVAMIYYYNDYPDVSSGSIRERLIPSGVDNFVSISSKVLRTVREARVWSPRARNCLFEDEMPRAFGKQYSFNKCITRCRVRSILVLCGCLLFQMRYEYLDVDTNTMFCTLQHTQCLKRYSFKWFNVLTRRANVNGLEREMEDALYCPDCLPSCTETWYEMSSLGLPINAYNMRTFSIKSRQLYNKTDLAILRVGFAKAHVRYYRQILINSWFEIFSNIGNICGIITGFSLIGFCEVLFFFAQQIWSTCKDEISTERIQRRNDKTNNDSNTEKLLILP